MAPSGITEVIFFASAAEAMRRILVEAARARLRKKRGGDNEQEELADSMVVAPLKSDRLLAVNDAMDLLEEVSPEAAQLVKLRYFVGFTNAEAADVMDISPRKGNDLWAYARVWLASKLGDQ